MIGMLVYRAASEAEIWLMRREYPGSLLRYIACPEVGKQPWHAIRPVFSAIVRRMEGQ